MEIDNSLSIALFVLTVFVICTIVVLLDARYKQKVYKIYSAKSVRFIVVFFILFGVAAASFVYIADRNMRIVTLHERFIEGNVGKGNNEPVIRTEEFVVEHPGTQHELYIWPSEDKKVKDYEGVMPPVKMQIDLQDSLYQTISSINYTFNCILDDSDRNEINHHYEWASLDTTFTPTKAGKHFLQVKLISEDIPKVMIRIADPLKTDGKRMEGY